MAASQLSGFKRFLLWDYPRAGWQYDVMVALILAFIFLTPRDFFRDQPKPSNVVRLEAQNGLSQYWVEPELLSAMSESERPARAAALLKNQFGKSVSVKRIEPMLDSEREVKAYLVYTQP